MRSAGRVARGGGDWAATVADVDAAVASLLEYGVPAAKGWDPRLLSSHPQLAARGFFETLDHPSIGEHPVPGLPYRFASVDRWTHRATASMGMDNVDVLTRILGRSPEEVAQLAAGGVIGTRPKGL